MIQFSQEDGRGLLVPGGISRPRMCQGYLFGLGGTFSPSLRASERPMAIACFRLVTFFPLRPLFNFPRCISCISVLTCLPAFGLCLRPERFFEEDFFADDFFAEVRFDEDFFAGDFRLLRFLLEDFFADDFRPDFLLAFFVAMGKTSREIGALLLQLRCIGESKMRAICLAIEGVLCC